VQFDHGQHREHSGGRCRRTRLHHDPAEVTGRQDSFVTDYEFLKSVSFPNNVGGRSDLRSLVHRFYSYVLYTSPCPLSPAVNTSHLRHPPMAFQIRRLHRSWSASLLPTLNISQDSSLIHKDLPILPLLPPSVSSYPAQRSSGRFAGRGSRS
jgi:hypothetical protein